MGSERVGALRFELRFERAALIGVHGTHLNLNPGDAFNGAGGLAYILLDRGFQGAPLNGEQNFHIRHIPAVVLANGLGAFNHPQLRDGAAQLWVFNGAQGRPERIRQRTIGGWNVRVGPLGVVLAHSFILSATKHTV